MIQLFYRAFLKRGEWPFPSFKWFGEAIHEDDVAARLAKVQAEHSVNREQGGWRWSVPELIEFKLGRTVELDYQI